MESIINWIFESPFHIGIAIGIAIILSILIYKANDIIDHIFKHR